MQKKAREEEQNKKYMRYIENKIADKSNYINNDM